MGSKKRTETTALKKPAPVGEAIGEMRSVVLAEEINTSRVRAAAARSRLEDLFNSLRNQGSEHAEKRADSYPGLAETARITCNELDAIHSLIDQINLEIFGSTGNTIVSN